MNLMKLVVNKIVHLNPNRFSFISDKKYILLRFYDTFNRLMDFSDPKTFNEKLQWLKLYDRKPEYTKMVDKYKVREYISEKIGKEYLIPLLGVWDDPDDIDFDTLPNEFVLKCNHNSGLGMCICKDKNNLDIQKVKIELKKGLKEDYYLSGREWPYKNVPRKIICEEYLGENPNDYKFFCFNGKVEYILVCSDRFESIKETFFDMNWNVAPFKRPNIEIDDKIKIPINFNKMIELSEFLSKDIPFLRVDFYEVDNKIYFGELTFFPASGFSGFEPEGWDYKLGELIELPENKNNKEG
ncbi:ATP-grasp fold amidoligase family protein [Anaerococcus sp.]|uniref:ATP-grasp fold amidoligase family protein n=1 Tax=Anaerococcus sp. TaxID=1872515 RepID=UPI0027B91656|nr:ATP-grasp fold amidoligase family protein [Anaerococcus sp.]